MTDFVTTFRNQVQNQGLDDVSLNANFWTERGEQGALVLALQEFPFREGLKSLLDLYSGCHIRSSRHGVEKDFAECGELGIDLDNTPVSLGFVDRAIEKRFKYPLPLGFELGQLFVDDGPFRGYAGNVLCPGIELIDHARKKTRLPKLFAKQEIYFRLQLLTQHVGIGAWDQTASSAKPGLSRVP